MKFNNLIYLNEDQQHYVIKQENSQKELNQTYQIIIISNYLQIILYFLKNSSTSFLTTRFARFGKFAL